MNVLRVQLSAQCASSGDGSVDWRATHCLGDSPSSGPRRSYLRSEHLDPRAPTTPSLLSPLIVGVYSLARLPWRYCLWSMPSYEIEKVPEDAILTAVVYIVSSAGHLLAVDPKVSQPRSAQEH